MAIETSRGLLVAALRTGPRQVYAINPLAAARYRDRHGVSGKKSDAQDAHVLANILRTDRDMHRALPADTDLAKAITVLARAQQDAVWNRQQLGNQLRSLLREYYPAALTAFQHKTSGLARPDTRAVLAAAPTPAVAAKLTKPQLKAALKRGGRQRSFDAEVERLQQILGAHDDGEPGPQVGNRRQHRTRQRRTATQPAPRTPATDRTGGIHGPAAHPTAEEPLVLQIAPLTAARDP